MNWISVLVIVAMNLADAQHLKFRSVVKASSGVAAKVEVQVKDDDALFKKGEKRQYVFGGYIVRDSEVVRAGVTNPYMNQYGIYLKHQGCGGGMYSTQMRLDNPPRVDGHETNFKGDYTKFIKISENNKADFYNFKSTRDLISVPCCPHSNKDFKCCKKYSVKGVSCNNPVGCTGQGVRVVKQET